MPDPDKIELAKEKMRQAEKALEDYLGSSPFNPEEEKGLLDAVKAARDEYVDQLAALFPRSPNNTDCQTANERELLALFRGLNEDDRQLLIFIAEKMASGMPSH